MADVFTEQLWQIPARILLGHGITESHAITIGEAMVDGGLITEETGRAYVAAHPEHAPSV